MTQRNGAARIAAPLVAAALVVLATAKRGPALSPDSAVYLSVADHLAAGRGWTQFDGATYVRWAPLYPLLLSLGPRLGLAAATVARVLQPLFFAGSVALCGAWLARHVRSAGWRVAALALIALSTIGIESAAFVWTESLDILLTLGCLVALDRWAARGDGRARWLVVATACAALACLTRYASLVLVPVGVLAIHFAPSAQGLRTGRRVATNASFALGASLPVGLWMARNVRLGAGLLGSEAGGGFSWASLAAQAGNAASHWVSPESSPPAVRVAALALFMVAVVGTLLVGFTRARGESRAWFAPGLLVAFMGAHKLAVLVGAHAAAVERIDERYLAPLFAPLVLVLAWAADRAVAAPSRPLVGRALAVLAGLWIAFTGLRTVDRERGYLGDGAWGLNNARWEKSALLAEVRLHRPAGLVYSNAPDALYTVAQVEARLWPRQFVYNAKAVRVDDVTKFNADVQASGGADLVWFYGLDRGFLVPPDSLVLNSFIRPLGHEYMDGLLIHAVPSSTRPFRW